MKIRVPLLPSWVRWIAVVGIAGFIFYVSIVTVPPETVVDQAKPGPPDLVQLDKWRHFVAYAVLGYALAYATVDWQLDSLYPALLVVGITVVYGVGIEFGQSFLPERYFSIGDAWANAFGGLLTIPWFAIRPYFQFIPINSLISRFL